MQPNGRCLHLHTGFKFSHARKAVKGARKKFIIKQTQIMSVTLS